MAEPAPRTRRWGWRIAFALLLLLVAGAAGIAIYGSDPVRVVALLQDVLRRDFGLVLTYEGAPKLTYWPRLGVALSGYRIDVVATKRPLLWGDALAIDVPWRAAYADEIEIERVELDAPVFHAAGLEGWQLDDRGDAAIRWPRITSGIVVRDAKYISASIPPTVVQGIGFESSPIVPGKPLEISATWERGDEDLAVAMKATPGETGEELLLDAIALDIRAGEASARIQGKAAYGYDATWFVSGVLDATRLPADVARYVVDDGAAQAPTSVEFRVEHGDAWQVYAHGLLAGVAIDADLRFVTPPDFSQPLPVVIEALRDGVHGHARIDRLRIGDALIEGFEITDDEAAQQ